MPGDGLKLTRSGRQGAPTAPIGIAPPLPSPTLPSPTRLTPTLRSLALRSLALRSLALLTLPSLAPPGLALPSLALPSLALPSLALPSLALPSLALLSLGGCHILDQTNLPQALGGAAPPPPPVAPPPPPPAGPPPLVTIRPAPGVDYVPALREAVAAARARKPDVQFDVVAAVPAAGDPDTQIAAARAGTAAAADIARAIADLGVPASQVRLSARTDPALTDASIRIYVQ